MGDEMESAVIVRIPPHSVEAEQSILGAMILDKEAINTAVEIIHPEDFYKEANGEIYEAILVLFNKNEPVDLITLSEELKRRGTLEHVGGVTYLANLSSGVATTANAEYYCKIVKDKSTLRRLIKSSNQIMGKAYEDSEEVGAIIEEAEKQIFDITQGAHREGFSPINEVLLESFARIEEMAANKGQLTGLTTGFLDIDNKLSGLQKSDLVLIAARPSMGKPPLGLMLYQCCPQGQAKVAIFSLEMSRAAGQRMIAAQPMDLQKIISGNLTEDEWLQIINSM